MIGIGHLLSVVDAYVEHVGVKEITLSHRLFGDSKKVTALREGADITLKRFNAALIWFSVNWPEGAGWPDDVPRPDPALSDVEPERLAS
jgi:hypothetical protein